MTDTILYEIYRNGMPLNIFLSKNDIKILFNTMNDGRFELSFDNDSHQASINYRSFKLSILPIINLSSSIENFSNAVKNIKMNLPLLTKKDVTNREEVPHGMSLSFHHILKKQRKKYYD